MKLDLKSEMATPTHQDVEDIKSCRDVRDQLGVTSVAVEEGNGSVEASAKSQK